VIEHVASVEAYPISVNNFMGKYSNLFDIAQTPEHIAQTLFLCYNANAILHNIGE
jgi:hypothetical protein